MKKLKDYTEANMISFSGGRSSGYMTNRLLCEKIRNPIVVFANTGKEHEKTLEFVNKCDVFWGGIVVWIEYDKLSGFKIKSYESASRNGEPFESLITQKKYCPNIVARFCTADLKIRPIKAYMMSLGYDYWTNIIGIRADEPRRILKLKESSIRDRWDNHMPMEAWGTTKEDVIKFWSNMPFDLGIPEYLGNCDMCFLKSFNKIKHIIKTEPNRANWWIEQESKTGGSFRKNYSYASLVKKIKAEPELFDDNNEPNCFCTSD